MYNSAWLAFRVCPTWNQILQLLMRRGSWLQKIAGFSYQMREHEAREHPPPAHSSPQTTYPREAKSLVREMIHVPTQERRKRLTAASRGRKRFNRGEKRKTRTPCP
uniref:Uncharacterized protein n=1 Tax=Setaria italica TaxID=4555 RepID=K3ZB14_SETIT